MKHPVVAALLFAFGVASPLRSLGDEPPRAYPPYPLAGDIDEYPRQNSLMPFFTGRVGFKDGQYLVGLVPGLELYLRDAFSVRAAVLIPVTKQTRAGVSGFVPFMLTAGGAVHLLGSRKIDPYLVGAAGIELNRNPEDATVAQPFAELGAGLQVFFLGWLALRLEYAYHLSYVPQSNGSYASGSHSALQLGGGVFF
jgi:hypothetical protein